MTVTVTVTIPVTVTVIVQVDYYDFTFQGFQLYPEHTIMPGDSFKTTCAYKNPTDETKFGLESTDEMCMYFMIYYPEVRARGPAAKTKRCCEVLLKSSTT